MRRLASVAAVATLLSTLGVGTRLAASSERESFLTLHAGTFDPVVHNTATPKVTSDFLARYCDGDACSYIAAAPLPNGSRLVGVELDACSTGPEGPINITVKKLGAAEAGRNTLYTGTVSASSGCGRFFGELTVIHSVDQFNNSYAVEVGMGEAGCTVDCPTINQRFLAVRLYYLGAAEGIVAPTKQTPYVVFPP